MSAHTTHCCPKHGCKYNSYMCPVSSGEENPALPKNNGCEWCEHDWHTKVLTPEEKKVVREFAESEMRKLSALYVCMIVEDQRVRTAERMAVLRSLLEKVT